MSKIMQLFNKKNWQKKRNESSGFDDPMTNLT